jgi:hypothetical protein
VNVLELENHELRKVTGGRGNLVDLGSGHRQQRH